MKMARLIPPTIRNWANRFHDSVRDVKEKAAYLIRGAGSRRAGSLGPELGPKVDAHAAKILDEFEEEHDESISTSHSAAVSARADKRKAIKEQVREAAERELLPQQAESDRLDADIQTAQRETAAHREYVNRLRNTTDAIRNQTVSHQRTVDTFQEALDGAKKAKASHEEEIRNVEGATRRAEKAAKDAREFPDKARAETEAALHQASTEAIERLLRSKFGLGSRFNLVEFNNRVRALTGRNVHIGGLELFTPNMNYGHVADRIEQMEREYRGLNRINWGLVGRGQFRNALREYRGRSLRLRDVFEISGNSQERHRLENRRDQLIMREYLESHHGQDMADRLMRNFGAEQYHDAVDMLQRWAQPDISSRAIDSALSGSPRDWAYRIAEFMGSRNLVTSSPEAIAEGLRHPWKTKAAGWALAAAMAAMLAQGAREYSGTAMNNIRESLQWLTNEAPIRRPVEQMPRPSPTPSAPQAPPSGAPGQPSPSPRPSAVAKNAFLDIAHRNIERFPQGESQEYPDNRGVRNDVYVAVRLEGAARTRGWLDDRGRLKQDPRTRNEMTALAKKINSELERTRKGLIKDGLLPIVTVEGKKGPQGNTLLTVRQVARADGFSSEDAHRVASRYAQMLEEWEKYKRQGD